MTVETAEQTKICTKCGVEKPLTEFRLLNDCWRVNSCDSCRRAQMMDYHHRTWLERYNRDHEIRKERTRKFYHGTLKPRNLALYGKVRSPRDTERSRNVRRKHKRLTGYAKTEAQRTQEREHFLLLRTKVIALYGGKCECCGESRYKMLTIDHKVRTYYKDKVRGVALVYDALREHEKSGYPNHRYQLLCWNCNTSRGFYGYCPHEMGHGDYESPRKTLKLEMIVAYGERCVLCGEVHWEFLTIDHINGGGTEHRRAIGSKDIYAWLKRRGWPKNGYRLLCANCNCSQTRNKPVIPEIVMEE